MAVYQEDVERALMISHKHIALVFLQMFAPLYLDRNEKCLQHQFTPHMARVISPEVPVAYGCTYAHFKGGDNS